MTSSGCPLKALQHSHELWFKVLTFDVLVNAEITDSNPVKALCKKQPQNRALYFSLASPQNKQSSTKARYVGTLH
jgi:CMP-2-keto-3-deoxyoctulosonic acid synthetase